MPSRRSGHKTDGYDVLMAGYVSRILVLWHVVAPISSANRRIAPLLVSYSSDSDCARFFKGFVVGKVVADHQAFIAREPKETGLGAEVQYGLGQTEPEGRRLVFLNMIVGFHLREPADALYGSARAAQASTHSKFSAALLSPRPV